MMGITMDEKQFIRDFKVFQQGAIDIFLGAGASFVLVFRREVI